LLSFWKKKSFRKLPHTKTTKRHIEGTATRNRIVTANTHNRIKILSETRPVEVALMSYSMS
jgi:hypothetical protein